MAATPTKFYRAKAPVNTAPALVTVPVGRRWIVTNIVATNGTTTARTFSIDIEGVPVVSTVQLQPGAIFTLDCVQVMEAGTQISIKAEVAAAIGVHISGVEVVL